ncbi:uncharacterized protein LOC129246812 [Anastrepha obliqua]|uniref:uncharacterized protein LOC129246812 n=1 Tax=Anastrepha obliqua TaxID=95512 RepID=UPI002409C73F|nr:uncharacterized protein LOC129246812 [Anastrepha obliqua]
MAMRRPRIKATALLTTKRKSRDVKSEQTLKSASDDCAADKSDGLSNALVENEGSKSKASTLSNKEDNQFHDVASPVAETKELQSNQPVTERSIETVKGKGESSERDYGNYSNCESSAVSQTEVQSSDKIKTNEISKNEKVVENADTSFKCPARVEYVRVNSQVTANVGAEDAFYTDMEESILQLDMQKTVPEKVPSPLKQQARQRIRPIPLFQRRNSFVSTASPVQGPSEDISTLTDIQSQDSTSVPEGEMAETSTAQKINPLTHRRERHYSASMVPSPLSTNSATGQHHYTPHKFTPTMGHGRIRTESNCSAFSDSFITPSKLRKNEDHANRPNSRRDFSCRIVNGNLDKSSLKMFDLIYYNPVTNPMEKRTAMPNIKKECTVDESDAKQTLDTKMEISDKTNTAMPVPQLKLNANGDLILDEKTLEIETTAEQEARKVLANSSLIFLDENTGMNGFYKRQKRTKEWPPEETIKFYRCLQTVGTDFSLMCQLFPKRTRRDLKLKFKKEERSNLALINKALLYPKLFNIDDLKTQLETEEREREEALQRWKEIHSKEAKTIKKVKINSSTAARALKNGDDVYENENVVKRKLSRRSNACEKKKTDSSKKPKISQTQHANGPPDDPTTEQSKKQKSRQKQSTLHNNSAETASTEVAPMTLPTMPREITPVKLEVANATNYAVKAEHHSSHDSNFLNSHIPQSNVEESSEIASRLDQIEEEFFGFIAPTSSGVEDYNKEILTPNNETHTNMVAAEAESKTFVDLDDGTVNTLQEDEDPTLMDSMPATPMSFTHRDVDECDIQQILIDLAHGSLVLVSTLDPDNADQVVNEIYMMDKTTGELCDKPLDIPESIVQGILSVMS